jgi:DNA replication protein DnaC
VDENLLTTASKKSRALFNEYEEKALESSGAWLLADPQLQSWLDRKSPLLWVSGGPGTGKSFLSSITISKLHTIYPQDPLHPNRMSVAYFYVKEHDQELKAFGNILKSLAYSANSPPRPGRQLG